MKVKDKVLLITGAGGGIGRELVLQLVAKGAIVVGIDRNSDALQETMTLASRPIEQCSSYVLDITDSAAIETCVQEVVHRYGRIDGLINNAGIIQKFIPVQELTLTQCRTIMEVNFFGMLMLTQAVLPSAAYEGRSTPRECLQYGGILTCSDANHLWGIKGSGQAHDRRING